MLAEALLMLMTPAGRMARRLGLRRESAALWARGQRQSAIWREHHEHCRQAVRDIVTELPQRRTAIVLGSGLMRDVPLALLADAFTHVILIDAVHLLPIRLRSLVHRNVTLLTRDLSGVMAWLDGKATGREKPLADLVTDGTIDLVISANLLSQLAWPVEDWLDRNPAVAARLPDDLPAHCIAWHVDDLRQFRGRVCLISDVEMVERDRSGCMTDRLDLMRGITLPPADASWNWTVAPFGEAGRDHEYHHRVCLWRDFNRPVMSAWEAEPREQHSPCVDVVGTNEHITMHVKNP